MNWRVALLIFEIAREIYIDEGVSGWMFKNGQIGHVVHYISTTRRRTSKRSTPSDSAHQIGLATLLIDVLTVDEGVSGWSLKNRQIGHVVHYTNQAPG